MGAGGTATVYRAWDERLGRDVAVKVIAERSAGDPRSVRRFRQEPERCARLAHPNTEHGRRRLKRALTTGLLAFAIAAAVLTASELSLFGGSVTGDGDTTLFDDRSTPRREQDETPPSDQEPGTTATATPDTATTPTSTPDEAATSTSTPTPDEEATPTPTPTPAAPVPPPTEPVPQQMRADDDD